MEKIDRFNCWLTKTFEVSTASREKERSRSG